MFHQSWGPSEPRFPQQVGCSQHSSVQLIWGGPRFHTASLRHLLQHSTTKTVQIFHKVRAQAKIQCEFHFQARNTVALHITSKTTTLTGKEAPKREGHTLLWLVKALSWPVFCTWDFELVTVLNRFKRRVTTTPKVGTLDQDKLHIVSRTVYQKW